MKLNRKAIVSALLTATVASAAILPTIASAWPVPGSWPIPLRISGSTTVLPSAQAVYNNVWNVSASDTAASIEDPGSGSGQGLQNLLGGTTDIADSSAALADNSGANPPVPAAIYTKNDVLTWLVGFDGITIIKNAAQPADSCFSQASGRPNITRTDIAHIYGVSTPYTQWSQVSTWVGGTGCDGAATIFPVARSTNGGTQQDFVKFLNGRGLTQAIENPYIGGTGVGQATGPWAHGMRGVGNPDIVNGVVGNANGIGYVGYGFASTMPSTGSVMALEGGVPTPDTIRQWITSGGTAGYVWGRPLYQFTLKPGTNPSRRDAESRAIDFVNAMVSGNGQIQLAIEDVALTSSHQIPDYDVNLERSTATGNIFKVNINDVVAVGNVWQQRSDPGCTSALNGAAPCHPHWIREDVTKDGLVNINDVVQVGTYWQQSWDYWTN